MLGSGQEAEGEREGEGSGRRRRRLRREERAAETGSDWPVRGSGWLLE